MRFLIPLGSSAGSFSAPSSAAESVVSVVCCIVGCISLRFCCDRFSRCVGQWRVDNAVLFRHLRLRLHGQPNKLAVRVLGWFVITTIQAV